MTKQEKPFSPSAKQIFQWAMALSQYNGGNLCTAVNDVLSALNRLSEVVDILAAVSAGEVLTASELRTLKSFQ